MKSLLKAIKNRFSKTSVGNTVHEARDTAEINNEESIVWTGRHIFISNRRVTTSLSALSLDGTIKIGTKKELLEETFPRLEGTWLALTKYNEDRLLDNFFSSERSIHLAKLKESRVIFELPLTKNEEIKDAVERSRLIDELLHESKRDNEKSNRFAASILEWHLELKLQPLGSDHLEALLSAGIVSVEELKQVEDSLLLSLSGIGVRKLELIRTMLNSASH